MLLAELPAWSLRLGVASGWVTDISLATFHAHSVIKLRLEIKRLRIETKKIEASEQKSDWRLALPTREEVREFGRGFGKAIHMFAPLIAVLAAAGGCVALIFTALRSIYRESTAPYAQFLGDPDDTLVAAMLLGGAVILLFIDRATRR